MRYIWIILFACCTGLHAQDYEIIFTKQVNNNDNIFALDSNRRLRQITNHPRKDSSPVLSPDGSMMVFTSERVGWWKIWVMDMANGDFKQLTNSSSAEYAPDWSPDGKSIVFISGRGGGAQIYRMSKDGEEIKQLTKEGSHAMPHWAEDGKIYFSRQIEDTYQIWFMDEDGTNQKQLTSNSGDKLMPRLAPDQTRILFYGNQDGNMEIYILEVSTKKISRLTNNPLMDIRARWSKDGRKIVFERGNKRNNQQIYLMDADGSNEKQLTKSGYNYAPSFAR